VTDELFNPFPGLRPFEPEEAHLFFGRHGQSDELLRRLEAHRFVAVVGTSGSGKSSLVRAGLLPSLYGGVLRSAGSGWRVAVFRPGGDPIGHLARALTLPVVLRDENEEDDPLAATMTEATLRRGSLGLIEVVSEARLPPGENLLIVVDQFEEIFRFRRTSEHADDAAAFVKLLLEGAARPDLPVYVILTMRSDYLGDCAQFRDLPEAINRGQYLIPRMTRDERRQAITGPVAVGGGTITPRLVNRLLNDVGDNPDQLPILQHALMCTWDYWAAHRRGDEPLDLPHYLAIGGMAEALSRHADEAFRALPGDRSRQVAEKVFRRLTERGPDNREIRRPTALAELCAVTGASRDEVMRVVDTFRASGRSFLMPPPDVVCGPDTLIDISHESLIRGWDRLRGWVDEEARSARMYRRLAETAALHREGRAGLWRDPDLALALEWWKRDRPNEAWGQVYDPGFERAAQFLEESRAASAREKAGRRRALRLTIGGLAAGLVLAVVLAAWALSARAETNAALRHVELLFQDRERALAMARDESEAARRAEQTAEEAAAEAVRREQEAVAAERQAERLRQEADSLTRIYYAYTLEAYNVLHDSAYARPEVADLFDNFLAMSDSFIQRMRDVTPRSLDPEVLHARNWMQRAYLQRLLALTGPAERRAEREAAAARAAEEGLELARSIRLRSPDLPTRVTLLWLYYNGGEMLRRLERLAPAEEAVREGLVLAAETGVDTDTRVLWWSADLHGLGSRIASARRDTAAAIRLGQQAVDQRRRLVERNPTRATRQGLRDMLDEYGLVLYQLERYAEALALHREQLSMDSMLTRTDTSLAVQRGLAFSLGRVGVSLNMVDSFPEAERALRQQLAAARDIAARGARASDSAEVVRTHANLSHLYYRWGGVALEARDTATALRRYRQSADLGGLTEGQSLRLLLNLYTSLGQVNTVLTAMDSTVSRIAVLRDRLALGHRMAALNDSTIYRTRVRLVVQDLAGGLETRAFELFSTDSFAEAARVAAEAVTLRREAYASLQNATTIRELAWALGNEAWYMLFARRADRAFEAAREGLRTSASETWIHTNEAHALLLLGRTDEAEQVYREWRGQRVGTRQRPWEDVIREDVGLLVEQGVMTPAQARMVEAWIRS
jgi:energy-coupling factor transporter ATP-binding protein EcfA2